MAFNSIRRFVWTSMAVSSVLILSSCNNMLNGKSTVLTSGSGSDIQSSQLDYATVNEQVFKPMCLNCHSNGNGNSGGVNLETYQNVINHLTNIKIDVQDGSMPASGPGLTADEKNMVIAWINGGAPESVSSTTPAPTPQPQPAPAPQPAPVPSPTPTPTLNFNTVYTEVLQTKCIGCHSSYSNYSSVKSDLANIKTRISNGSMPRGSTLTTQQKQTILDWINAGGPQ